MQIESKLPAVGTTIFSTMTNLANEAGAINLSQGFPDFEVAPELIELVHANMRAGHNQYAPMPGVMALREQIAAKIAALYKVDYDPATEITVTTGATEAMYAAVTAVVRPGDEVIVFEPAFDSYVPAILINGGIPKYVSYKYPEYRIDWDEVAATITPKTRLLIINTPHNPTATVLDADDMQALIRITRDTGTLILSDEVYEHIIFDGRGHESMLCYPELAARSFVVNSFGKTFHATGWKVGYCAAPAALSAELQRMRQFMTFSVNTPVQLAYAAYMADKTTYLELADFYQQKRDFFLHCLTDSRFKPLACSGTYYLMADYSAISAESDQEFCKRMIVDHGVAAIPPSAFYHTGEDNRVVRFCFAKKEETLQQAAERLAGI